METEEKTQRFMFVENEHNDVDRLLINRCHNLLFSHGPDSLPGLLNAGYFQVLMKNCMLSVWSNEIREKLSTWIVFL